MQKPNRKRNLIATASNLIVIASNLLAMASKLIANNCSGELIAPRLLRHWKVLGARFKAHQADQDSSC